MRILCWLSHYFSKKPAISPQFGEETQANRLVERNLASCSRLHCIQPRLSAPYCLLEKFIAKDRPAQDAGEKNLRDHIRCSRDFKLCQRPVSSQRRKRICWVLVPPRTNIHQQQPICGNRRVSEHERLGRID